MTTAFAPGRVNLIGDHTDYTGGWALPMAIQLGTTVSFTPGGESLDVPVPEATAYVAAVAALVAPGCTGRLTIDTTLPIGAGLSSSAALEVACALALGFTGSPLELALLCQQAEHDASGVPCGLMDQLASTSGVAGHALLMDCGANTVDPVPVPGGVEIVALHSGEPRALAGSAYAERRAQCEAAEAVIGPLRDATVPALGEIGDEVVRRRARHVITENRRTVEMAAALRAGDPTTAGLLMRASHASLAEDFAVSTPRLDDMVRALTATPGVFGARVTGAGFGGCVVALTEPGAVEGGWRLQPSGSARTV